jgi:hypothetical protein
MFIIVNKKLLNYGNLNNLYGESDEDGLPPPIFLVKISSNDLWQFLNNKTL